MTLTSNDRERLIAYYTESLTKHGPESPRSLHWITTPGQIARFEVLTKIGNLSGQTILDIGSGLGDLYGFLKGRFHNFIYTGLDIVPDMVKQARIKYPTANFRIGDMFSETGHYDYLLASGALTFNIGGGKETYYDLLARIYRQANKGVACNMLDANFFSSDETYITYRPEEVALVCGQITNSYKIVSGYLSGDFTLFLYKNSL
jgi:SAM-dependent methyltransferase